MYTPDDFSNDVTKHFEFLESEYRMRREPMKREGTSTWITYASDVAKVIVEHDVGGYCSVAVQNPRYVKADPLERLEFDLDEVLAVSGSRPGKRQEPRSMSEAVARAADTLRQAGARVLNGDFEALHARQRKVVESVRKNNPAASAN